jgi:Cu/Ag efflux protein CusF
MFSAKVFSIAAAGLLISMLSGCGTKPEEKHYALTGEVISVDAAHKMVTIKHGEIPGLMPAMTMGYQVAEPKQLEDLRPGDTVSADLVVSDNRGRLEKITLVHSKNGKN